MHVTLASLNAVIHAPHASVTDFDRNDRKGVAR